MTTAVLFFQQKTAYEMRISDWSSDVCSSDLGAIKAMAMIECKDVSKWYGTFQVLTNCSTTVEKGEVIVVCGPSGSGKSTLIKCVNALEPFQKGVKIGRASCRERVSQYV